jgi:hypothetical protein
MLRWMRKQAKPFAALGLAGLLTQTLVLCCITSAYAVTAGLENNSSRASHCHTEAVAQKWHSSAQNDEANTSGLVSTIAGSGPHCPPTGKSDCCDNEAKAISGNAAVGALLQTVDFNADLAGGHVTGLLPLNFETQQSLWVGTPPTLAGPPLFLSHCAFLE